MNAIQTTSITDVLPRETIETFNLDEKELRIIDCVLCNLLDGRDSIKAADVLTKTGGKQLSALRSYKHIIRLIQCGILEPVNMASEHSFEILYTRIKLSNNFLALCFEESAEDDAILPYTDNHEYLSDQCKRIDLIHEINEYNFFKSSNGSTRPSISKMRLAALESRIAKRLASSNQTFPLEQFKKKKGLSRIDELAIIAVLRREMISAENFEIHELSGLIEQYPFKDDIKRLSTESNLFKKAILELQHSNKTTTVALGEKYKKALLGDIYISKKRAIDSFFEVHKPSATLQDVILHAETQEAVNLACSKVRGEVAKKLRKWGVLKNIQSKSYQQSATILFYGPSGTGKTLTAHAVAAHLKKELLIFDCSRILGMWVGESEKNTRKIFDQYRKISKEQRNPPVLLLNEADQFLHRRINAERSVDHMYNQMQNIFLEQLENFEGVLIATTNLPDNMDPAFSRRFEHKIEFKKPGPEQRLRLWQIHIPDKIPIDASVNLNRLAESYDLSGGQISLIVRNAITIAVTRGRLSQEDLVRACNAELSGSFDLNKKASIGF